MVVAGTRRGRRVGGRERHQDRALPRRRRARLPPPVLGLHPRVYSRSTFCKSAVLKPCWSFPKRLLSVLPTPDAGPGVSPGGARGGQRGGQSSGAASSCLRGATGSPAPPAQTRAPLLEAATDRARLLPFFSKPPSPFPPFPWASLSLSGPSPLR